MDHLDFMKLAREREGTPQQDPGRIFMGPFPGVSLEEFMTALDVSDEYGIRLSSGFSSITHEDTPEGLYLQAIGPGVTGYLLDQDGSEADSSDVEAFLRRVLPEGARITISGSYSLECGTVIRSLEHVHHVGGSVHRIQSRSRITPDGVEHIFTEIDAPEQRSRALDGEEGMVP